MLNKNFKVNKLFSPFKPNSEGGLVASQIERTTQSSSPEFLSFFVDIIGATAMNLENSLKEAESLINNKDKDDDNKVIQADTSLKASDNALSVMIKNLKQEPSGRPFTVQFRFGEKRVSATDKQSALAYEILKEAVINPVGFAQSDYNLKVKEVANRVAGLVNKGWIFPGLEEETKSK